MPLPTGRLTKSPFTPLQNKRPHMTEEVPSGGPPLFDFLYVLLFCIRSRIRHHGRLRALLGLAGVGRFRRCCWFGLVRWFGRLLRFRRSCRVGRLSRLRIRRFLRFRRCGRLRRLLRFRRCCRLTRFRIFRLLRLLLVRFFLIRFFRLVFLRRLWLR